MKLEFYPVKELKKAVLEIIDKYLDTDLYRIFFFGSRIKGNNFPRADIDIGIEGQQEIPGEIKMKIKEDLERLPTLYKFDFVDFKNVSEKFKKEALKHIEYIK